ncbi:hypothetical protein BH11GEM2_BH11GEM2_35030 [soil metagenome]
MKIPGHANPDGDELALLTSEARLRLALDLAELGTWTWDIAASTGELDARAAEIVGLPAGRLYNVAEAQIAAIHPDDVVSTQALSAAGFASGVPFDLAYRVIHLDGSVHFIESRACALNDEQGCPTQVVGINRDVTLERSARVERERLLSAADEANRAKGQFLGVMSHELRTPLNAIGGYAELMSLGLRGPVTELQLKDLERIQQSQRHLLGIINQILNYTRVDAGAVVYDMVDVPVTMALAAAEALIVPQVRARGLTYVLSAFSPHLAVRADYDKLQQVIVNLLSNAVKFTDAGGEVRVGCVESGDMISITVSDTGVGIETEKQQTVFEPFVQVDVLSRPRDGVGLGLAISRDLARGMGGDLVVASTLGEGSVFTVTLPRAIGS